MRVLNGVLKIGAMAASLNLSGCAALATRDAPRYEVGVGSAIHSGSPTPVARTKASVEIYFGQYRVEHGGDGRGCCYATGKSSFNTGKPRGALMAIWSATTYSDEQFYSEEFNVWLPKPLKRSYYYAVAREPQLAAYPKRTPGHKMYGTYVSAGRVVVSELALSPGDVAGAVPFLADDGKSKRYVLGNESSLYYKVLSHGAGVIRALDDPSPWNRIQGIEITEAQYREISKCEFDKGCRSFLSAEDDDLSKEQREYVERNPVTRSDFKRLIKLLERSSRRSQRWAWNDGGAARIRCT